MCILFIIFYLFTDVDVETCKDVRDDCHDQKFFCEFYGSYMVKYCQKYCNLCHMSEDGKFPISKIKNQITFNHYATIIWCNSNLLYSVTLKVYW